MATGLVGTNDDGTQVFDVKLMWTHGTSRMQTGFSLRRYAALLGGPQEAAGHVDAALRTAFIGLLHPSDTFLGVDVVNPRTKEGGSTSPTGIVGLSNAALAPSFQSAILALKGERRTQWGQGRMFLPCYFETLVDGDNLNPTGVGLYTAFVDALVNEYVDTGVGSEWQLINWHETLPADRPTKKSTPLPFVASSWYDVASVRLNPLVTSLKSRKANKGS